jgi:hypothetical protein
MFSAAMRDDADRLGEILVQFARDPDNSAIWPAARELADRFTFDQLSEMAGGRGEEVRRLFDRVLGRTTCQPDPAAFCIRRSPRLGKRLSI